MTLPQIIQGGMGLGVSGWSLAAAVSRCGQLGVVSGVGLGLILPRRLQLGDPGGHYRRALAAFPCPSIARSILNRYFIEGGKQPNEPFLPASMPSVTDPMAFDQLCVAGCFAEVYLAKEGHSHPIGMNLLTKVQVQTLPSLYGAMLAGVDVVLMGAGIPVQVPAILDRFAAGEAAELSLDVTAEGRNAARTLRLDPQAVLGATPPKLRRPAFYPIISSASLATILLRKSSGKVNGFVIESSQAGGHNAPPRGVRVNNARGEPVWGQRDVVDLAAMRDLDLPFYLAGHRASPEGLAAALAEGASGIQVGTAFAFCRESGLREDLKSAVIAMARKGGLDVFTDPLASPTGFPFKVLQVPGTLSEQQVYTHRTRACDWGYLREAYLLPTGGIGWRCPAEPLDRYAAKGGESANTAGRKCLCTGLAAAAGLASCDAQGNPEPMIVTAGDDIACVGQMLQPGAGHYSAADVIAAITGRSAT